MAEPSRAARVRIDSQEYTPPPPLARQVARIWRLWGVSEREELVLPDVVGADIVLNLATAGCYRTAPGSSWQAQPPRLVVGGLDRAMALCHGGATDIIGIQLAPGCTCLLGVPAAALRGQVLELGAVMPALDRALAAWMDAYAQGRAGLRQLAELLCAHAARCGHRCNLHVAAAVAAIVDTHGLCSIAEIADELAVSRRHLARCFTQALGCSPKQFARVARFARSWQQFALAPPERWAELAVELGYCDQSHLIREFTELAGVSPARLFAPAWYDGVSMTAASMPMSHLSNS